MKEKEIRQVLAPFSKGAPHGESLFSNCANRWFPTFEVGTLVIYKNNVFALFLIIYYNIKKNIFSCTFAAVIIF